ncbi:MAG: hypothetical protein AAGE59_32410 [Cyanobacteria bacterium P01_F01_bin.86]
MIDPQVYAKELALLQRWFGKELDDLVSGALFRALNERMDTEAFSLACRLIFEQTKPSPFNFPSCKDFVEAARGSIEEKASQEWMIASDFSSRSDLNQLSEIGSQALRRVGGRYDLGHLPTDQMPFKKKEFIREYASIEAELRRQTVLSLPAERRGLHALG